MDTLLLLPPSERVPEDLPPADAGPMLIARSRSFAPGHRIPAHRHARGQFLYAVAGTMGVRTPGRVWLVPPSRALWLPAGTEHVVHAHGDVHMRTLYLDAISAARLPARCAALDVTPLLRELIVRLTTPVDPAETEDTRELAARLAVAEIGQLPACALALPLPQSADLAAWCEGWLREIGGVPGDALSAAPTSMSPRTLYRRFQQETGISFVRWRQQACLLEAVRRLAAGVAVTRVALDLGYDSPSAFTAMFRRALGASPRAFFARGANGSTAGDFA